jgi:uncharacterized protein (DUF3820 family)
MHPKYLRLLVTREIPFGKPKGRLIADFPGKRAMELSCRLFV